MSTLQEQESYDDDDEEGTVHEEDTSIYGLAFNHVQPINYDLFAATCCNRCMVYKCLKGGGFQQVSIYADDDEQEEFYVCEWSADEEGTPLVLVAGKKGVIHVVASDVCTLADEGVGVAVQSFVGHGASINDLSVHTTKLHLFLSASRDLSVRMWDMRTGVCVAIFGGCGGHINEVLTVDWQLMDEWRFVSGGLDNSVKMWDLAGRVDLRAALEAWPTLEVQHEDPPTLTFPTGTVSRPIFDSHEVHSQQYIDCVRSVGPCVLSRSADNRSAKGANFLLLWQPQLQPDTASSPTSHLYTLIKRFKLPDSNGTWWLRFSTDRSRQLLAAGNLSGHVFLFHLFSPSDTHFADLHCKEATTVVRQTAISSDGGIVLGGYGNGRIHRWDRA